ncbi:MAG: hypothetical protein JWQ03_3136 [Variovorax sp.]|nr:hypothetical protein [Variovorax sp.]
MEPASIRYKNPGAMWGSALAIKWGASKRAVSLNDGKGQGNNIAVFPTYVQGICAQLDLWRTSNKYKNKKFADAIAIWSGGNYVESYIKFVLDRVPGMTRNTVMNDAFWKSSMGIAFLKAQAWHEAGKQYPAPDADWVEAQRLVFATKTAASNVQPPTAEVDETLKGYQAALISFGYFEVGNADGRIGGKTLGAIKAFFTDRGVDAKSEYPSPVLANEIAKARSYRDAAGRSWKRPIAPSRAYATEDQVAEKVASVAPTQRASLWQTVTGYFSAGGAVVGGAVKLLPDANDQASPYVAVLQQWIPSVPSLLILGVVAAIAIATAIQLRKANAATQADYQKGKIN